MTELSLLIKRSMDEQGIKNQEELIKIAEISIDINCFQRWIGGTRSLKEDDLLKLSETLKIPITEFEKYMDKKTTYKVIAPKFTFSEETFMTEEEKKIYQRVYDRIYRNQKRKGMIKE